MIHPFEITLVIGVALLCLEMLTATYVSLSLGIGVLGASLAEAVAGDFVLNRDMLIFGGATIIAFIALRLVFGRRGDVKIADGDVNQF